MHLVKLQPQEALLCVVQPSPFLFHAPPPHPPRVLLSMPLCLSGLQDLKLHQEMVGSLLQVRVGYAELYICEEYLQAGKFWGLQEVLRVKLYPGAQDGGHGPGGDTGAAESETWPFHHTSLWGHPAGTWASVPSATAHAEVNSPPHSISPG